MITEAARQAFVTQPMISNSVRDLEKEIGIEIFSRNAKEISITSEGAEFLSYARQVVEQTELLERRYTGKKKMAWQICSFSTQHYAFAVNAFVNFVRKMNAEEYDFTLRETRTYET